MTVARKEYRPLGRWDAISCLALAVLTVVLFLYFLRPPILSDQLDYFYHAWQTDGLQPTHRHLRIGLVFPVHLAIKMFGYSELSYYVVPSFGALSLALATWFVARILFGTWTGIFASALMVSNPQVLTSFSDLLPDYLSAGLYTWSLGILIWCWRTGRLATRPDEWPTFFLLALSGFFIGWSYLAREYVVFFFPSVIFVLLLASAQTASFVAVALGAAFCWLLELTWGLIKHGDPLARLHAVVSPRAVSQFVEMDVVDVLFQLPHLVLNRSGGLLFACLLVFGIGASAWCSLSGDRRWQLLALWLIGGWLFFTVVALMPVILLGEEHVYLRMHKFRYWALILPPGVIAGVAGSQQLIGFLARRVDPGGAHCAGASAIGIAAAVVFLGATIAVVSASKYSGLVRNGMDDYLEFRRFMKNVEDADELVLLQGGPLLESSGRSLPIYLNAWNGSDEVWRGRVVNASTRDLDDIITKPGRKLVAIDLSRTQWLRSTGRGRSPEAVLQRLEDAGERIFDSSGERVVVYKVEGKQEGD
jgi:hypothetical protein